jgi:hypothetical protein
MRALDEAIVDLSRDYSSLSSVKVKVKATGREGGL